MALTYEIRRHSPKTRLSFIDEYAALEDLMGPKPESADGFKPPPATPVTLRLVARLDGAQRVTIKPPIELEVKRNSMGEYVWFGRQKVPGKGTRSKRLTRLLPLEAEARFIVRIESKNAFYAPKETIRIGPDLDHDPSEIDEPISLPPGVNYPFVGVDPMSEGEGFRPGTGPTLLRGGVSHTDGRGWERVRVSTKVTVAGDEREVIYPQTDQSGQWVLALTGRSSKRIEEFSVSLKFEFPNDPPITVPDVPIVTGRQTIHTQTSLRGRVLDWRGLGMADVTITASTDPDVESHTRKDGTWSLHFPLDRYLAPGDEKDTTIAAVTPDGQTETQEARIRPRRTSLVEDIHFTST